MTKRNLPKIEAFFPEGFELDPPPAALERFHPVVAKTGDDPNRTLAITGEIGEGFENGISVGYVRGALRRMGKGPDGLMRGARDANDDDRPSTDRAVSRGRKGAGGPVGNGKHAGGIRSHRR